LGFFLRLLFVGLFAIPAAAHTTILRGVVSNDSGAVVPGAKVSISAGASNKLLDAVSAVDGSYSFAGIEPGTYTIQASAPDLVAIPITVQLGPGIQTLNIQLKVAVVAQQVTVEEHGATVTPEPSNNSSATVLGGDDLQSLSDNPDDLLADLIAIAGRSRSVKCGSTRTHSLPNTIAWAQTGLKS